MSAARPQRPFDTAVVAARDRENVIVGNEIVRHRLVSRVIHWSLAFTFFVCVFTGMPIWTPVFGWMAHLFGGLTVCRLLHPWAGVAFFLASGIMFVHWIGDMRLEPGDREWLGPKAFAYMRYETEDTDVGKYNGGQRLFFCAARLGAIGLPLSGLLMWFPRAFPPRSSFTSTWGRRPSRAPSDRWSAAP